MEPKEARFSAAAMRQHGGLVARAMGCAWKGASFYERRKLEKANRNLFKEYSAVATKLGVFF